MSHKAYQEDSNPSNQNNGCFLLDNADYGDSDSESMKSAFEDYFEIYDVDQQDWTTGDVEWTKSDEYSGSQQRPIHSETEASETVEVELHAESMSITDTKCLMYPQYKEFEKFKTLMEIDQQPKTTNKITHNEQQDWPCDENWTKSDEFSGSKKKLPYQSETEAGKAMELAHAEADSNCLTCLQCIDACCVLS